MFFSLTGYIHSIGVFDESYRSVHNLKESDPLSLVKGVVNLFSAGKQVVPNRFNTLGSEIV